MRTTAWSILTATSLGLLAAHGAAPAGIDWMHAYGEAKKQASSSNKLMLIDFYTDW